MRSTEVSSTGTWGTDYEAGTGSSKIFLPGFLEKSPVVLTFLLGFVLSYLLSTRIMVVIEAYHTPVQAVEPFLWTFGDSTAILLSSLLLLLLFADLPGLTPVSPYYLIRMTRKNGLPESCSM